MKVRHKNWKNYSILILLTSFCLVVISLLAFQAGEEFQVNTYTYSYQHNPAIAMDKKGNFVITWASSGQDGSSWGIYAQRFNRKGKPIGSEFQANTYTENGQGTPAIVMKTKENFIITWGSYGQDGSDFGIFAKMFKK